MFMCAVFFHGTKTCTSDSQCKQQNKIPRTLKLNELCALDQTAAN